MIPSNGRQCGRSEFGSFLGFNILTKNTFHSNHFKANERTFHVSRYFERAEVKLFFLRLSWKVTTLRQSCHTFSFSSFFPFSFFSFRNKNSFWFDQSHEKDLDTKLPWIWTKFVMSFKARETFNTNWVFDLRVTTLRSSATKAGIQAAFKVLRSISNSFTMLIEWLRKMF